MVAAHSYNTYIEPHYKHNYLRVMLEIQLILQLNAYKLT